ncbi:hypothetical protein GQ457_01G030510 [Hibiscus cannabinus]
MASEIERPRITELQVRMDCNGCVQKIRKALHGIRGIYEVYPDIAQQKLTVVGWADPEKIVKAIRKTRKTVTICSHSEPPEAAAQPPDQLPGQGQGQAVPQETVNPTPSEAPPPAEAAAAPQPEAEAAPSAEPPRDQPPLESLQPEPAPAPADASAGQQPNQPLGPKDVGEVHVICHHPPDYGHRYGYVHSYGGGPCGRQYPTCHGQCSFYPNGQPFHHEPPPQPQPQPQLPPPFVTHSYNTYKPSPYVTQYEYIRSPPRYSHFSRIDHYNDEYYSNYSYGSSNSSSNGNFSSMFSDENPNACRIM